MQFQLISLRWLDVNCLTRPRQRRHLRTRA